MMQELEKKLNYTFRNPALLSEAMSHSSYANEHRANHLNSNERLEFLGDSVLSLVVSRYLYSAYSNLAEGELTRMRAELVCERALSSFADEIRLGDYLLLGVGEEKNRGRERKAILADAFEALLAAIYLDAGDRAMAIIDAFLLPLVEKDLSELISKGIDGDYKTPLQQLVQQTEGDVLEYVLIRADGGVEVNGIDVRIEE